MRRATRSVLSKLRDFERRKKLKRLCEKQGRRGAYVPLLLDALLDLTQQAFAGITATTRSADRDRLLREIENLKAILSRACETRRPVPKSIVTRILKVHRRVFERVLKASPRLPFSNSAWSEMALLAVALWDNRVRGI